MKFQGHQFDWRIELDFGKAVRLKKDGIVNLLSGDTDEISKIEFSLEVFGQVLATLCEDQIKQKGFTPEQFAADIPKGKIREIRNGLFQELVDFFLDAAQPEMATYCRKVRTEVAAAREKMSRKLEETDLTSVIDEQMDKIDIPQEIRRQIGSNSGSKSEARSASTPGP